MLFNDAFSAADMTASNEMGTW